MSFQYNQTPVEFAATMILKKKHMDNYYSTFELCWGPFADSYIFIYCIKFQDIFNDYRKTHHKASFMYHFLITFKTMDKH